MWWDKQKKWLHITSLTTAELKCITWILWEPRQHILAVSAQQTSTRPQLPNCIFQCRSNLTFHELYKDQMHSLLPGLHNWAVARLWDFGPMRLWMNPSKMLQSSRKGVHVVTPVKVYTLKNRTWKASWMNQTDEGKYLSCTSPFPLKVYWGDAKSPF